MTRRGFTLLEILVVLAILGFGIGLVSQMTATAARHAERVEEETTVQLACENVMNAILSGDMIATIGVSTPIPDAPNWETTVELLDGPIESVVAIRVTAQRYSIEVVPSYEDPTVAIETKVADPGRVYAVKEFARRAEIKTRVVRTDETGRASAVDGTGETVWNDLGYDENELGGGLGGAPQDDPFSAIDRAFSGFGAPTETSTSVDALGGGLGF